MALTGIAGTVFAQDQPEGYFSSPEAIEHRLQAVQEQQRLAIADAPVSAVLERLEVALYQHREAVRNLETTRAQMQAAVAEGNRWQGFDQEPPYSILLAEELRARQHALLGQKQAVEARIRIINAAIQSAKDGLADRQRAFRQHDEQAASSDSPAGRREAERLARLEDLQAQLLGEQLARLQLRLEAQEMELQALAALEGVVAGQIESVRGQVAFSDEELAGILARVDAERAELVAMAESRFQDGSSAELPFTWKLEFLGLEHQFWTLLHTAMNAASDADRNRALGEIESLAASVANWVDAISLHVTAPGSQRTGVGVQATVEDLERVTRLQNQVAFTLDQLHGEGLRGTPVLDRVKAVLLGIWEAELYLAEETSSIGGNKVTQFRAVTLGKLLRLVVILLVGWYVIRFLAGRLKKALARQGKVSQESAEAAGNWVLGIGFALLVIFGLNRVHIPFTAFAFLGGTLAIGIGFGAQTVLKNFISGIILKVEQPFRVGNLVRVDTITGRIQRIGLRASVIRHFDGVDTLIPNSSLLENRVSNWTYGDSRARGRVTVGVAYGSSTREVTRCLLEVAEAHGLVLDKPKPEVRFDDFGDNALVFSLLFWFDASQTRDNPLASDLRYMIEKALTEAGIVIAFPQRDIHLDSERPLRIELSRVEQPADDTVDGDPPPRSLPG